ncbi:MAG: protein-tyrosine phosphatase family protein [Planctomycetota bacterium]|jgi:protein-tyrosine phosphatase
MNLCKIRGVEANQVAGSLFQGSAPIGMEAERSINEVVDVLVLCAEEYQPKGRFRKSLVLKIPFRDVEGPVDRYLFWDLLNTAAMVRACLDKGDIALVTCMAGLNRSGLVTAMTLMLPGNCEQWTLGGLSAVQAVHLIRCARGRYALSNRQFLNQLSRLERRMVRLPSCNQRLRSHLQDQ